MKNNGTKYFAMALLWFAMGLLCSLSSIYSFTNGISRLVMPVTKYLITAKYPKFTLTLADFILFHIADYLFVLVFAFILSAVTGGKKTFWAIAFIIGAIVIPSYGLTIYLNEEHKTVIQILITNFLMVPFITWLGVTLGNKYRFNRQNTTTGST